MPVGLGAGNSVRAGQHKPKMTLPSLKPAGSASFNPVLKDQLDAAAKRLWLTWPQNYADFLAKFGPGRIGALRVFAPQSIEANLWALRDAIAKMPLQASEGSELPRDRARETVPLAAVEGSLVVFHPSDPKSVWWIGRDGKAEKFDSDNMWESLLAKMNIGGSGSTADFVPDVPPSNGESANETAKHENGQHDHEHGEDDCCGGHSHSTNPTGSLDNILETARNFAFAQGFLATAQKMIAGVPASDMELEALVLGGSGVEAESGAGYLARYGLKDGQGNRFGSFRFWTDGQKFEGGFGE